MTAQTTRRYAFSFITGALFIPETLAVSELLAAGKDWPAIRSAFLDENLLRIKTSGSRLRILREIRYRLQEFDAAFRSSMPPNLISSARRVLGINC